MARQTTRNPRKYFWLLPLIGLVCTSSCSDGDHSEQRKLLDGLPNEMIHHLISSDDSTFAEYGRKAGFVVLSDATREINKRIARAFIDGDDGAGSALLEYNKRIARVVTYDYDYPLFLNQLEFIENFPPDARRKVLRQEADFYAFRLETDRPANERIETFKRMLDEFKENDNVLFMACAEYELSCVHKTLGNENIEVRYLRKANEHFAECGLHEMTVGTLGELGLFYEKSGATDSMIVCYEKAKKIANESRLPLEAASIASLYAKHYARGGRLSLAYDLILEAMETCRTYKGEYLELGYIVETMVFHARLNCWDIVGKLVGRARVLQSAHENNPRGYFRLYSLQTDRVDGQMNMAKGRVDEAEILFHRAMAAIDSLDLPYTREPERAILYAGWARGLLDNGRAQEALDIGRRGLRLSRGAGLPEDAARCALLVAEAALRLKDRGTAEWAIQTFESHAGDDSQSLQREWIKRDALLGALERQNGDVQASRQALETGLSRLRHFVSNRDASAQSYLWINECEEIRQLMHDLTAHDPDLGYGAELLWRDFYRLLGRGPRAPGLEDKVTIEDFRKRAEAVRKRITELDAVLCHYVDRGEEVWRWTVSSEGIRRESLGASPADLRKLTDDAWRLMTPDPTNPDAPPPSGLAQKLRTLSHLLLPRGVRQKSVPFKGPLLITADGFLGRLPFETLDVGENDQYTPLLLHRDVAYLRFAGEPESYANTNAGIILASNKPSRELRNRYPFQQNLPEALAEAKAIAALQQNHKLLVGESATKSNLRSLWEEAPFVYLAAHTLRDPQVPYLMLIPLAVPAGLEAPAAQYLDFTDIRTASFRRCQLVVLSGCSSGAPYVEADNSGPSLGDAFLDAGAAAVIQTFWDVRDDHARELMTSFVPSWQAPAASKIRALCNARRNLLHDTAGTAHISRWAAFSIKISRI